MVEVKADGLEESFEQFEDDGVAALKAELDVLKAKIASGAIQGQRPALDGVKSQETNVFTEQYLRRGIEAGLEVKAIGNSSDSAGGYPLIEADDMPDIAAGSLSIAFGSFKAGYVIAERNATTIFAIPKRTSPTSTSTRQSAWAGRS